MVATPIGNLEDVTYRAVRILREVDLICCEDTRHTKILLERYNIIKPLVSYHQHSKITKIDYIISELKSGKNVALVSDAGTPGINDPGGVLIGEVVKHNSGKVVKVCHSERVPAGRVEESLNIRDSSTEFYSSRNDTIGVVPIPGPSAITTLLSVCGMPADKFLFLGFLPKKKGRATLISNIQFLISKNKDLPIVIYESPHRIVKTLKDFAEIACPAKLRRSGGNWQVVIGRELTKKFEEIFRGNIVEAIEHFSKNQPKGEFVVCLKNKLKS